MAITVKLFAQLKEVIGKEVFVVESPMKIQFNDLIQLLIDNEPKLQPFLKSGTRVAVNCELAGESHWIHENDEVALLPPFSGG